MNNNFVWTDGIEHALTSIYQNSQIISEHHNSRYYYYKGFQKYFRVPIIILSGVNSVFNVGLQPFIDQGTISVLCCGISLICGIISSIELFLGIQNMMEKELVSSKEFYILGCDIFKTLSVERNHRLFDGSIYLDKINTQYCNLIVQGNLIDKQTNEFKFEIKKINFNVEDIKKDNNVIDNYVNENEDDNFIINLD
jgi:hypothetical protein